jgi:hypothetical protein
MAPATRLVLALVVVVGLLAASTGPVWAVAYTSPTLSVLAPAYRSDSAISFLGIVDVRNVRISDPTNAATIPPPASSPVTIQSFFDIYTELSLDGGGTWAPATSQADAQVYVNSLPVPVGEERFVQTEMLQFNVSGGGLPPGAMIRESPTLTSPGTINAIAGPGSLHTISATFQLNVELTIDGGVTWIPASGPVMLESVPEPGTLVLLCLASLGGLAYAWRRPKTA